MNLDQLELELRRVAGVRAVGFAEHEGVLLVQVQVIDRRSDDEAAGAAAEITRLVGRLVDQPVTVEVVRWRNGPLPSAGRATPTAGRVGGTIDLRDGARSQGAVAAAAEDGEDEVGAAGADAGPDFEVIAGAEIPADALPTGDDQGTNVPGPAPYDGSGARIRLLATMSLPDSGEIEVHLGLGERRTIGRAPAGRGLVGAVEATVGALRPLVGDLEFEPSWATTLEGRDDPTLVAVGLRSLSGEAVRYGVARSTSGLEAAAKATLHALNRTVALRTLPAA